MREYKATKLDDNEISLSTNISTANKLSKLKTLISPTKKAISKEFVETDSNDSSDENKKTLKKSVVSQQKKSSKENKLPSDKSSEKSTTDESEESSNEESD